MKKAIFSFNYYRTIKENRCFEECSKSRHDYSLKIGADYILRTDLVHDDILSNKYGDHINFRLLFEKLSIFELFKVYDRVLYLDGDVFVKPDAPDIFMEYPDMDHGYMINEVKCNNINYDLQIQKVIDDKKINWGMSNGHYDFYNAGVMLISKKQMNIFNFDINDYFVFDDLPLIVDQPYYHYNIDKFNISIKDLNEKWNAMYYFNKDGHFLHYANVHDRNKIFGGK